MIHIEILSSSDPQALGLYEFEHDSLFIGRSKKNDLIFLDEKLPYSYMILQIIHGELAAKSLVRSPYFFVNGKKVSGVLKIRPNDVIAFGKNQIKILKFSRTREEEDLSLLYENFKKNASELEFALNLIEEVLIDLENKAQHV